MADSLISEFLKVGDITQRQAAVTAQVYLELIRVKKYWNVDYKYNETFRILYLVAQRAKTSEQMIFLPIVLSERLSFASMQKYLQLSDRKSVYLVICASDSTTVYYQISEGIGDPPNETSTYSIENSREFINKKLLFNKKLLEQSALYGIPITLSEKKSEPSPEEDVYSD